MNWMKYRFLYILISGTVIALGFFSVIHWGLIFGVDFKGGSILEYKFTKNIDEEKIKNEIEGSGVSVSSVQKTQTGTYLFRLTVIDQDKRDKIQALITKQDDQALELRFENVGPSVGPELVKKTIIALVISACGILLWITYQFKSFKYGLSAVLAMLHDSLVLIGVYSLFGHFFGAEIDFLFVTALLTILSFSVHDTIVVYDRIREMKKKVGGSVAELADSALTETMVRSLNNSMTIVFMLLALILLGGSTIRFFAVALLIGTISGTYSSPFVAVPILVTWDELLEKMKHRSRG